MKELDTKKVASAWINAFEEGFVDVESNKWYWSVDLMLDLVRDNPDVAWQIIREIVLLLPNDSYILRYLGAGPLEDLMSTSGAHFMGQVSDFAAECDRFLSAMKSVVLDEQDCSKYKEFYRIAGIEAPYD